MSEKTVSFVRSMVVHFSGLGTMLDEHIEANGEILPHVFFGDVTRYVVGLFRNSEASPELHDLLGHLEEAFQRDGPEVRELISVSFLENLPRDSEPGAGIRKLLGPSLANELRAIG
jgi:hypothetical protein